MIQLPIPRSNINSGTRLSSAVISIVTLYGLVLNVSSLALLFSLAQWGQDKMADFSQTTFSNEFFLNENTWISHKISLKFVPKGPINTIPALVQIMAWRLPGAKPMSEPMLVSLLTDAYMRHSVSMS